MQGLFSAQFNYATGLPCQPIQLQKDMVYRIISRQPITAECSEFTLDGITDETFFVNNDTRLIIKRGITSSSHFYEYVVIIGYPNNIIHNARIGFNQKIVFDYHEFWNSGSDYFEIPCSAIKSFFTSKLDLILIDEIIAHRYNIDTPDDFSIGQGMGINNIQFFDLSLNMNMKIFTPNLINYRTNSPDECRTSSLFHWKANTHDESIILSISNDNYIRLYNFFLGVYDCPTYLTIKFRAF